MCASCYLGDDPLFLRVHDELVHLMFDRGVDADSTLWGVIRDDVLQVQLILLVL
jgi:hypothetical protein